MTDISEYQVLTVKGVSKSFGGLGALKKVDLSIEQGKITGLIGPNGAGKTTLFNIIAGIYHADEGSIFLENDCLDNLPVHKRVEKGIARTFQITRLFKSMSAIENVMVGGHPWSIRNRVGAVFSSMVNKRSVRLQHAEIYEYAVEMLKFSGIEGIKNELAGNLPHGQQRLLEMARALATKPKLLLLDEPAAGLNPHEVDMLREALKSIVAKTETTILLVEHDMRLVMNVCDWVYVLNFGIKIAEGFTKDIAKNKDVVKAYLGREY
jgi:branched-chain amino acid transport system ATP-binding protein